MAESVRGLIAAPFTPMHPDGSVNLDAVGPYADLLHRNGLAGAFICGTTGEGLSLTTRERLDLAERWVSATAGREPLKLIVHVGHTSLAECRILAAHAQAAGAWGIGAMGPCFFRPQTVGDLADFCAAVASAAPDLPFYYYHIPSMTGVNFPMIDLLRAVAGRIPNFAGIKYTWENLMDYGLCLAFEGGRYDMLFGRDEILLAGLALGARGAVGSTYNFAAGLYHRILEAFGKGDLETARSLQGKSMEMIRLLVQFDGTALASGKAMMKAVGLDCGPVRPPLRNLTAEQESRLFSDLAKMGLADFYCR
ncbi:MAG: dihydrodipicolinate synthase family protein [Planctomycetes bacterium]|nr:dihydrodipicolinate synthase family protein [Planctomycetota bacterium]